MANSIILYYRVGGTYKQPTYLQFHSIALRLHNKGQTATLTNILYFVTTLDIELTIMW